jgi:hypothetical protein
MTATATGAYATAALLKSRLGVTDTTDDTALGTICDQVNAYIESPAACGRVLAPIASAAIKLDGDGTRILHYPKGIRAVSLLEVANYTGAAYQTIAAGDYFLRPGPADLMPGWPFTRIVLSDHPAGSHSIFPAGLDTVRMTATTGWNVIPDEITDIALTSATRAWHSVQTGQTDIVGTNEMGQPLVSRFFSARDLATLRAYSVNIP